MKSYSSREVIKILNENGWYEVACAGNHHQYKHHTIKEKTTITHPRKDIPIGTLKNISTVRGIKFP